MEGRSNRLGEALLNLVGAHVLLSCLLRVNLETLGASQEKERGVEVLHQMQFINYSLIILAGYKPI